MTFSNDFQIINGNRHNITAVEIGGFNATEQKYLFAVPEGLPPKIKGIGIDDVILLSDTSTNVSDSNNNYEFQVVNLTALKDLLTKAVSTEGNEISGDNIFSIKPDQNNSNLGAGTVLELQITKNLLPTDLSNAEVIAVVYWHWEV